MQVGVLVRLQKDNPLCEIRTSSGATHRVSINNGKFYRSLVLFNPENPNEIRPFKHTEDNWLKVFEDYENNAYNDDIKPFIFVYSITHSSQLSDIHLFESAINKYIQSRASIKEKLLNDIWELASYVSKTHQNEIASVLSKYDARYIPTQEKAITIDAIAYCVNLLQRVHSYELDKTPRDIDQKDIFQKIAILDSIIRQTPDIPHKSDNKLIQILLWKNGLANSFDFNTLRSFFYCFGLGARLNILRKLVYEKEQSCRQIGTDDLISLIESNPKMKTVQQGYEGSLYTFLSLELLIYGLDAYTKTGRFLSQGRIIEILNQINDRRSKISLGLRSLFDFCNGGLTKEYKYEANNNKPYLFDRAYFLKEARYLEKNKHMYECLKNPCNGRISSKIDEILGKHFLWCNGYPCFRSTIKKQTDYKKYKFIDFCTAFELKPYEETDSGLVPNDELSKFIDTLSKVSRITDHLYCESCKQLLFPYKRSEKEHISTYNTFSCQNHNCTQKDAIIYINHCHTPNCIGVIDSRHHKKCPNGMHICPECFGCCSDRFYQKQKAFRLSSGLPVPSMVENQIANKAGHNDKEIFYCYKCGNKLIDNRCNSCDVEHKDVKRYKYE